MMEGEDEKQFICRYCSKRYPCGKSLGGHLRSHTTAKDRTGIVPKPKPKPILDHSAASESAAYVLRENPKKTRRFADSRDGHLNWFCKECGKGFQSMKALCGHMACHSDKDKEELLDSQSDTETTRRGKRSKRQRYKTLDFNSNPSMFLSVANGSSEIEQEQEEVALCLMLLSRDCAYGKARSSFVECSDNSSIVLEAKSSSIDMKPKSDGFERFNNLKGKNKPAFNAELGKLASIKADRSVPKRRIKDHEICQKKIENGTASIDKSWKIAHKNNGCSESICESGENNIEADSFSSKAKRLGTNKSKGHSCPICFREFKSGQALGGHKRSHFIDDRGLVFVPRISGLLDLNLPAPDEEEDMPGSWQGRLGGSTSMTRQVGLR